jgi:putative (di)nucleoside polyphosphate hydrolase
VRNRAGQVIDSNGFRPNVGLVIANSEGQVLWARRRGENAWQFPQGGVKDGESVEDALYRELDEEVGLARGDVAILGRTNGWLRYRLPRHLIRRRQRPVCVGQKQVWFLLQLIADERRIRLDRYPRPEFDDWMWLDYWDAVRHVVFFKRRVYKRALTQLAPLLFPGDDPAHPLDGRPAGPRG